MTYTKLLIALVFSSFCLVLQGMDQRKNRVAKFPPACAKKHASPFDMLKIKAEQKMNSLLGQTDSFDNLKITSEQKMNALPEKTEHFVKIKAFEEPGPLVIWNMPNVLQQQEPVSCGLHSLKNAILLIKKLPSCTKSLKAKIGKFSFQALRDSLYYEDYFLKVAIPRFKPIVSRFREKVALQEYVEKQLLPLLSSTTKNEQFRKIIKDGSSAIAEQALLELKEKKTVTLYNTNIITVLHVSQPTETLRKDYNINRLRENINIPKEHLVINKETIKKAFHDKYLLPILEKYKINETEKFEEELTQTLASNEYDQCVSTINNIKDVDINLIKQIESINNKMSYSDNIDPFLLEIAQIKRKCLAQQLEKYKLSLPDNEDLFNNFIENPYMFADLQGFWLEGNELRKLISLGCDSGVKEHIMVIDSIDELNNKEFLNNNTKLQKVNFTRTKVRGFFKEQFIDF